MRAWQAYLYRAAYDAFVHSRAAFESSLVELAYDTLAAGAGGVDASVAAALRVLNTSIPDASVTPLRTLMAQLVADLNVSVGVMVLQCQNPSLSFGNLDAPISDVGFLTHSLTGIAALGNATARAQAVSALLQWGGGGGGGGLYDWLGATADAPRPHLDPGQGATSDPSFYFTPLQSFEGLTPQSNVTRMSWRTFVQAFYDASVTLRYSADEIEAGAAYTLRVVYFASTNWQPGHPQNRLVVNGNYVVHDYMYPPYPMEVLQFTIPGNVTAAGGGLQLSCNQPPGLGTSGRCCQISEVWLTPVRQ